MPMERDIQLLLNRHAGVDDWKIWSTTRHEFQLYAAADRIESQRDVEQRHLICTVYHDRGTGSGRQRGESTFTVTPDMIGGIGPLIDEAVVSAAATSADYYDLPSMGTYADVPLVDEAIVTDSPAMARHLLSLVLEESGRENVRPAQIEFFLGGCERRLLTSRGIDLGFRETDLFTEMVFLAEDRGQVAEFMVSMNERTIDETRLRELARSGARCARDSLHPRAPRSGRSSIVLQRDTVKRFLRPLVFHSGAQSLYEGMNRCKPGEAIQNVTAGKTDPLSMWTDATIPHARGSYPCDSDGIAAGRHLLIEQGLLKGFWAPNRFARQLKIPCTGEFGNMIVGQGNHSFEELLACSDDSPVYLVESLSSLEPNMNTGSFSSEIKLAYELTPSGRVPVKGGSVAGNVFTALERLFFSREMTYFKDYRGPVAVRIDAVRIAGEND